MKNFLVYKSSAGSGKTYTLMLEYLSMALRYPKAFNRILAITFTNKAANEIKDRILKNLKLLALMKADSIPAQHAGLVEQLSKRTGLSHDDLFKNAGLVLQAILHNYSDFAVSTIDSFMHKVIRSIAFDLKLSVNFEVELDTGALIDAAVDELIAKVGKVDDLTQILEYYVVQKAEEDENWDISSDLRKKAAALFKEKMTGLLPVLEEKTPDHSQYVELCKRVSSLKEQIKQAGEEALGMIHSNGFEQDDFTQGAKGIYGFFAKCARGDKTDPNSYVRKALDEGAWFRKGSKLCDGFAAIEGKVTELGSEICRILLDLKMVEIVRDNFHSTLLLKKINDELNFLRDERNVVSINDFTNLIAGVVKDQPVPFIYMRVGEKFRHFMIDEFQDTSEMQWQNLLPLIENGLSVSFMSMIVGDGKQAIYRFKNGNALQFVNLPNLKGAESDELMMIRQRVLQDQYNENVLQTNYRSRQEIVEFNNDFFSFAAPLFVPDYVSFYNEVKQLWKPDNEGGMVNIDFVEQGKAIEKVLETISKVKEAGYEYGDIAILCRRNKDGVIIAEALKAEGISVVSSESLLLGNSNEVMFLINLIYLLAFPDDGIALQGVIEYLKKQVDVETAEISDKTGRSAMNDLLMKMGIDLNLRQYAGYSFYDAVESLVRKFRLSEINPIYVRFFLDVVHDFTKTESSGAEGFIEYWKRNCGKLSVSLSDNRESVRILTVHKSKGLDFPVVIYAFPDPRLPSDDLSWSEVSVKLNGEKTLDIPLVYTYGSRLKNTPLEDDYNEESALSALDRFNLYYVAFTRASERLYLILDEVKKEPSQPGKLSDLMSMYLSQKGLGNSFGEGYRVKGNYKESREESEAYLVDLGFTPGEWNDRIILARQSKGKLNAGGGDADSSIDKVEYGIAVHRVLSLIDSPAEITGAVEQALSEQKSASAGFRQKLNNDITAFLSKDEIKPFFTGGKVFKEKEILAPDGNSYRPDRVVIHDDATYVIDYKTGLPVSGHEKQLNTYMQLLSEMGYDNICGYLIYLGDSFDIVKLAFAEPQKICSDI